MPVNIGTLEGLIRFKDQSISTFKTAWANIDKTGEKMEALGRQFSDVGEGMTKAITVPLLAIGGLSVKAASDFESSFAGVRKTVNATEEEFAQLESQLRDLASGQNAIPIDVNELNAVAEAAGQLGIAKDDIVAFTRTMADLGQTTNLTADEAATATAQFQNIFGAAGKQVSNFGSTLVALGNAGASTEKQIIDMGLRIAGAGVQIGLTQGEVLAFASSLSSVGIEAEAGGSAISKVMINIALATRKGGQELVDFARISGMSVEEFRRAFATDAAGAVTSFIEGLGKLKESGGDVLTTLDQMEITEVRMRDALLRAAGAGDLLSDSLELQSRAWKDNTALTSEAEKRYQTFESQLKIFGNRLKDVAITFGSALLPVLRDALTAATPLIDTLADMARWFGSLPGPVKLVTIAIAGIAAAAGPVLIITGQLITAWGTIVSVAPSVVAALQSINLTLAATVTVIAGVLLAINALISKWKEALGAAIAYQVGSANLEGRALEFSRVVARGKGTVSETIYSQAQSDLVKLQEEMSKAQAKVDTLNKRMKTASPDQAWIASKDLAEAQKNLTSTTQAYDRLRGSLSKVTTVTKEQAKEGKVLDINLGALTGTTAKLADSQDDLAKELADTIKQFALSTKHHKELEKLYKSNATQNHIDDVEDAHEVYKQYLSDVDKFGKVAADTLRALNEQDIKAARNAEKAHKVWLSRAESMRKFVDQTERLVNIYADQALGDLISSIKTDLEDAASLTAAMATDAERWVAEEIRAKELLDKGLISHETYDRLLRSHTEQLNLQESSWERQRRTVEAMAGEINNWASVFGTVLEGVNDQVSQVIGGVETFTAGLQAYNREGATWSERAGAGVQMGQGIFQAGQGFGLWQGNRGQSNFGGQMSGDYADVGAMVGGLFGPVWGLVGAVVGSFIKKGADEGIARVDELFGELSAGGGGDRSLRDAAKGTAEDIKDSIEAVLLAIGGELTNLTSVLIKIRDNIISVSVGAVKEQFSTMEEALAFALSEALRQATITGISPQMQAALTNTTADTVEEFLADIQTAQIAERFGMADTQIALDDLTLNFVAFTDKLVELGISTEGAVDNYNEQIQRLKDQYLGFNRSTADWLKNLAGINAGIDSANEDLRRKVQHQMNMMQERIDTLIFQGPRTLSLPTPGGQPGETISVRETREQWEAAIAELRRQQEEYLEQLNNLPQRMSEAEIDMGIFQALFQYLGNSRKYAEQAHKYALMRVEVEFESIRLQLIAMNKWEQFAGMWNDALAAARQQAGEEGRGRGRGQGSGGGGGRADAREWLVDRQAEVAARGMGEYARQQAEIIRLYSEQISQAGRDITLRTQLITLRDQELEQLRQQEVGDIVKRFQENMGLVNQFDQVRSTAADFIKDINSSPLGDVRKANMIARVLESVERTIERMSMETARGLLGEMVADLERFGASQALISEAQRHMALIEHTLKMSHYQTEIEILKAQGKLAPEVLATLEKSLEFLNGIDPLVLIAPPSDEPYSPVIMIPRDWWGENVIDASNRFGDALKKARDLLAKYQSDGLLPIQRTLRDINTDFVEIYKQLGATAETIGAHAGAIGRAIDQWLEPIRNLRQDLFYGELSPHDTETQFNAALSEFLSAQAAFDSGDISVIDDLPEIVQRFMGLLREMTPIGSQGFEQWAEIVDELLERVEGVTAQDIMADPVVLGLSELTEVNNDQLAAMRDVRISTARTAQAVISLNSKFVASPTPEGDEMPGRYALGYAS